MDNDDLASERRDLGQQRGDDRVEVARHVTDVLVPEVEAYGAGIMRIGLGHQRELVAGPHQFAEGHAGVKEVVGDVEFGKRWENAQ